MQLRVETQLMAHIDALLYVLALIHADVVALVVTACRPVSEWRDPSTCWPDLGLSAWLKCAFKPGTSAFDYQVRVQDGLVLT